MNECAVLEYLLSETPAGCMEVGPAAMKAACLEWFGICKGVREEAEVKLAMQLDHDLLEHFVASASEKSPDERLTVTFLCDALRMVNFRRVARALFNRFLPVKRRRPEMVPSVN